MSICNFLQFFVNGVQSIVNLAYWQLNVLFGIAIPDVSTWFNPILQPLLGCTV